MNKKIVTNLYEDVKNFYHSNIPFKILQVQKSSGIYSKVKKEYIAKYPTRYKGIQLNSTEYINALCLDCDHNDVMLYQDYNIPEPTITTINQGNGRHHHIYFLENPIPLHVKNLITNEYVKDVYNSLVYRLEADINYTNMITKNFLNKKDFRVIGSLKKYKLEDFREYIIDKKQHPSINLQETIFSRHLSLFNDLRYFGYEIAKNCSDESELYISILNYAERMNKNFQEPIKVRYIAKNVSNFCWLNRDNFNQRRWNWNGYVKQTIEESFKNRSHKQRNRRKKEILKNWQLKIARNEIN